MNIEKYINNTKRVLNDYWNSTLEQRLANGAGSCYDQYKTIAELEKALLESEWEVTTHPDVTVGCKVFKAPLKGRFGLKKVSDLSESTLFTTDDRKGTGKVSLTISDVKGEVVNYTYLIVGEENGVEVVFTFHPGEPIRPSKISTNDFPHGSQISKEEAIKLGFEWAKIV